MERLIQARAFANRISTLAGREPLQVFLKWKRGILARFTNNGVHQNGFQDLFTYTLRWLTEKGPLWIESNDPSDEGIRGTLRVLRSRSQGLGVPREQGTGRPLAVTAPKEYFPLPVEKMPQEAAQAIEKAVRLIRNEKASANGYYSAYERIFYLKDSSGLERFHPATAARFGITATKGAAKGYLSGYHPNPQKLNVDAVVREALELSQEAARGEISVPPGIYECVFSPRALLELMEPLRRHFDAQLCEDKKSVFSGLLAKKIFSSAFTLSDDFKHSGQFGIPFDAEGHSRNRAVVVESGHLKNLLGKGHSSRGWREHPFDPMNLVVEKGTLSREKIFCKIRRGIFINKIWYHTLVRESAMEVTGLATAGSVFIENGRVQGRAVRLRYHDSIFSILGSVVAATSEQILLKDGEMGAALLPYLWVSRLRVV